jgi:hypothetical protein
MEPASGIALSLHSAAGVRRGQQQTELRRVTPTAHVDSEIDTPEEERRRNGHRARQNDRNER